MGFLDRIRDKGAPATPAEADQLVVRQLAGMGADLARPRHVIHFLYFADEQDARAAANEIERAGYDTAVTPPDAKTADWSVRAEGTRVVSSATVAAFRSAFDRIATEFHGEYDGWEASPKP